MILPELRSSKIEIFPFAFGEVVEGVGAEAGAVEGFDVVALAGEHAADLVVATFREGEGGASGPGDFEVGGETRLGFAAEDEVAAGEGVDEDWVEVSVDGDFVGFFEVGFG